MAHTKSAIKHIRTSREAQLRNRIRRTTIKSQSRKLTDAIAAQDQDAAKKAFASLCSALDKGAKTGSIKKPTATRRKSRAAAAIRKAFAG
ncbi:MAG TPA: 30S ribosomal protein S20 [Kiritimatiellia bacterium]|nr:30S ribosomal protein S20 [Kiritimatiellia bacterium]